MKYTIMGFQQKKLIDNGLDTDDALILSTIKDMYSSASMEFIIEDDNKYMWINYKYFLDQIPIIGSRSKLMDRIKKYEDKGLIKRLLKHERKGRKGNFAYIAPTIKFDSLQDYDPYPETGQGLSRNWTRVIQKLDNKDSSIRDTSIKDDVNDAIKFYQDNFSLVTPYIADCIQGMVDELGEEMTIQAMKVALKNNVRKIRYVEAILYDWSKNNIRTIDDLKAHEIERQHPGTQTNRAKDVEETQKMLAEMWGDDE